MINIELNKSFSKFRKENSKELQSILTVNNSNRNLNIENIEFFYFLHKLSVSSEFRDKWFNISHFNNIKDNSTIQQSSLLKIIITILEDENLNHFNNRGNKGQVWYLFANAVASYSSHNPYYMISEKSIKILNNFQINFKKPISRSKIFNVRDNGKKLLTFEHMCPSTYLIKKMIEYRVKFFENNNQKTFKEEIKTILESYGLVSIITKEEDDMINKNNLRTNLYEITNSGLINMYYRYKISNIKLSETLVPVYGKMYR